MNGSEFIFIYAPLMAVLVTAIVVELRTGLIYDLLTVPAFLYLSIARAAIGPSPWYVYVGSGVLAVLVLAFVGVAIPRKFGRSELAGMGAIKLASVVAVALEAPADVWFIGLCITALPAVALLIIRVTARDWLPSSPLTAAGAVVAVAVVRVAAGG